MLAFLSNFILFFAEAASTAAKSEGGWSKFVHFWETYANYPGFEAWKFLNLIVFIIIMVKLLKRPLSEAFKTKRETIRAELIRAEEQRQAALARLTATEGRLAQLDTESVNVVERARLEAESEKERIARETEDEVNKLRQQAASEIERVGQQVKKELRRFSAEESIRLAEERIRRDINAEKDARLVKTNIQAIGGLN
ncbi:MAG TPA: ATP synthase F0 subunit B [Pyrinomonadaceae bacterium]|jgi:F0F1-type ATP synthase membrane subunit b/b'